MKRGVANIAFLLITNLSAGLIYAQSDRASINGSVKDSSGAVVPGVQVRALNTDTNDEQITVTNGEGLYYVRNLPIGTYSLTFSRSGFRNFERKGLTLQISQIAEVNVVLTVGTQVETVEVTAEAPLLQSQTAALSMNLTNEAITELPINVRGGRNLSAFIFAYVPGVEGSDYDSHINGSLTKTKEVMNRRRVNGRSEGVPTGFSLGREVGTSIVRKRPGEIISVAIYVCQLVSCYIPRKHVCVQLRAL